jgi:hypothetical protein
MLRYDINMNTDTIRVGLASNGGLRAENFSTGVRPVEGDDALGQGAALLIDEALVRMTRAREVAPAWMAKLLLQMHEGAMHVPLGRSSLRDFAREELGLTPWMLADLLRLGRGFKRAPALFDAILDGRLSGAAARKLLPLLESDADLEPWFERVRLFPACHIEAEVDAELERREREADTTPPRDLSRPTGRVRFSFSAPPEFLLRWADLVQLVRKLEQQGLSDWQVAEILAAEWSSSYPVGTLPGPAVDEGEAESRPARAWRDATVRWRWLEEDTECWEFLAWERHPARLMPDDEAEMARATSSPREVRRRLLYLSRLERVLDSRLAVLLATLKRHRLARRLQFHGFKHYVKERLRLCTRRAYYLMGLGARMEERPPLEAAFREGELSWLQAMLLGKLPAGSPALPAWIARARAITVRRLEQEVARALVAMAQPGAQAAAAWPPEDPVSGPGEKAPPEVQATTRPVSPPEEVEVQVTIFMPPDVASLVERAVESVRELSGFRGLEVWQCLDVMIEHFRASREPEVEREEARSDRRIFVRDGWRCQMPGCTSSAMGLHDHHIVFRSRGGTDDEDRRLAACVFCHLRLIHGGFIRVSGKVSEGVVVELGTAGGEPPLSGWVRERRVAA